MNDRPADDRPAEPAPPDGGTVSAGEALAMGWQCLTGDFGSLLVVGLVVEGILLGMQCVPCLNYLAPIANLFVYPPMMAGLFFAVRAKIDGGPAMAGWVFKPFGHGYWDCVVAGLPITLAALVLGVGAFAIQIGGNFAMIPLMEQFQQNLGGGSSGALPLPQFGAIAAMYAIPIVLAVTRAMIQGVIVLVFAFGLIFIWDYPGRGWEAAKRSAALVRNHLTDALLIGLAFAGLYMVAWFGVLACCIGIFFTNAIVDVWFAATLIYVYRVWTGQPIVQEFAGPPETWASASAVVGPAAPGVGFVPPGVSPPPAEGPIPPTDVGP